jgi:hypothetical protein
MAGCSAPPASSPTCEQVSDQNGWRKTIWCPSSSYSWWSANETARTAISWGIDALTQFPEQKARWIADFDGVTPNRRRRDRPLGITGDRHASHSRWCRHTRRSGTQRRRQVADLVLGGQPGLRALHAPRPAGLDAQAEPAHGFGRPRRSCSSHGVSSDLRTGVRCHTPHQVRRNPKPYYITRGCNRHARWSSPRSCARLASAERAMVHHPGVGACMATVGNARPCVRRRSGRTPPAGAMRPDCAAPHLPRRTSFSHLLAHR